MSKNKILTPAGTVFNSAVPVPKIKSVKPCGAQVLIEFLTQQEMLGTTLVVNEKMDLKVPLQGYVRAVGPNFKSSDYGFDIGDRVTVSGAGIHVPNWDGINRDRFLMEPTSVKGVIVEETV
jgi:hypothetical protein